MSHEAAKALRLPGALLELSRAAKSLRTDWWGAAVRASGWAGRAGIQAPGIETGPSLLGVGLLQQARPKLSLVARFDEEVLVVQYR